MAPLAPDAAAGFDLLERRVDHPDASGLLRAFYDEQVGRYGFAEAVDLDPAAYAPPAGLFLVAHQGSRPVACGCFRWYDKATGTVEIKKAYVVPAARRHGLGRALLARLETEAIGWGACMVILETGVRNTAALRLFADLDYRPIARYVADRDPSINRAFAKRLTPSTDG